MHNVNNLKKILLVVRWPVGGIRTFIRYVYKNFDPNQWRFSIIAPEIDEMRVLMEDLSGLDIAWIPVRGIPDDGSSGFWKITRCVARHLAREKYNLVHSHGFTSGLCASLPSFSRGIPHLMTSHDVINDDQFSGIKGGLKKIGMGTVFSLISKIHSVSYDAQDNLVSFFPGLAKKNGKLLVIPNGIDTDRFLTAEPRNLRLELGLNDDVFLIGFFGRFMKQKGFHYLVEAIEILTKKNLPRKPLVLAFGEGGFIREEKQSIIEKGLESYFRFLPFTPNVAGAIKGLDVVVMPSLWEACPLLPMETLVSGTPLIASNCIGLREVIKDTPSRIVPSGNSTALADIIHKEILDPSKNKSMSFIEEAAERFCVKKQAAELQKISMNLSVQ